MPDSGIAVVGEVPWGTHLCQFYDSPQDLLDILVPYFRAGLHGGEYCMWVTSEPLCAADALAALRDAVPDLDAHVERGAIEVLPHDQWYLRDGTFDADRVLAGWVERHDRARSLGFRGLRLSGNTMWLEPALWSEFTEYERKVDETLASFHMIAVCTYSLNRCNAAEVLDVVKNHEFALIAREGRWTRVESTDARIAREQLRATRARYHELFAAMNEGMAVHEIILDSHGEPCDYRFLEVNPAFERLTGIRRDDCVGRTVREVLPGVERYWIDTYGRVALTGEPAHFEQFAAPLGRWYEVHAYRPAPGQFATLFVDVTDRRRAAEELRRASDELRRSNQELEQFAYVASHDLREPLAVVAGYADLLKRRYGAKLDSAAKEYLDFAADGARRMQELIDDLLEYSRVASRGSEPGPVDCEAALERALANLHGTIEATRARIVHDPLPVIVGDHGQIVRLFQNLLGNAMKFRGEDPPEVRIHVERRGDRWHFSVKDNGIGIDPRFHDRVFQLFQRLHPQERYPGTGIGLAICRKVVERHGGRIWVESAPGEGATFHFEL